MNTAKKSLRKILLLVFIFIIGVMVIPTIYATVVLQIHTTQYDDIISNVSQANEISQIAKNDIPNELWEIVCGKKDFMHSEQYYQINTIYTGIDEMLSRTKSSNSKAQLEVANRTCLTLSKNITKLETQIEAGASVTQNEILLDEIRTITSLFSDVMQNYIITEIENANIATNAIKRSSITLTILQLILIALTLVVSILASLSVSKSFVQPLSDMQKLSDDIAQGNLSARTSIPEVKELVPFAVNMNKMAEQIELLIQKNTEEQKNFQKAEMKALQAQITPHFLYNTFDTIIWLAEEEDTERVVKITKAFSEFLRISLSKGHEWITIGQELDHIRNYLTIQKIRYADILNYDIITDESLNEVRIIKLVLQPLIENAIYHGIKNKRGRGHIEVRIEPLQTDEDFLRIIVKDDGAGFTPERLEQVNKELNTATEDSEKLSTVYGLFNVHKKLKLYYGDKTEGLKIISQQNKGTEISFIIPCMGEQYV